MIFVWNALQTMLYPITNGSWLYGHKNLIVGLIEKCSRFLCPAFLLLFKKIYLILKILSLGVTWALFFKYLFFQKFDFHINFSTLSTVLPSIMHNAIGFSNKRKHWQNPRRCEVLTFVQCIHSENYCVSVCNNCYWKIIYYFISKFNFLEGVVYISVV